MNNKMGEGHLALSQIHDVGSGEHPKLDVSLSFCVSRVRRLFSGGGVFCLAALGKERKASEHSCVNIWRAAQKSDLRNQGSATKI